MSKNLDFYERHSGQGMSPQFGDWISVGRILNGGQLHVNPFYAFTDFSPQTVGPELAVSLDEPLYIYSHPYQLSLHHQFHNNPGKYLSMTL